MPSLFGFLAGGGAMGARIRDHRWEDTPLGPLRDWPQTLRLALGICLNASFPTAIYWGPELRLLYNDAWAPIPDDRHPWALGRPAAEVWADIWDVVGPQFRSVMETGQGFSTFDQLLRMRRGDQVEDSWWNYSFTPIRAEDGTVVGIFNQGNETTDRIRLERRLSAERQLLAGMFEQAPGFMAMLRGPDHVFELANPPYRRLVGNRAVIGRPVRDVLPELEGQPFFALLDECYRTGQPYVGRGVPVTLGQDGAAESRVVDFVYQPIRGADGQVEGIFVEGADVTDRVRAEAALRESEQRFRNMADNAPVIVWVTDPTGACTYLNRNWYLTTGQTKAQALGFGWLGALHDDDRPEAARIFLDANARRVPFRLEYRLRVAGGGYRWTIDAAAPRFAPDGAFLGYVGSVIDIDERRGMEQQLRELNDTLEQRVVAEVAERTRAEEALRQAQKMEAVGQLTGGIAHDFNNLLQAIQACLELLARRTASVDGVPPLLDAGRQAVDRGARLVRQLMAFARRQDLRPEAVDVRDRLLGMRGLLERALKAGMDLRFDLPAGLWAVLVDPVQLELAVLNLVVNARDAMTPGGRLVVGARNMAPNDPNAAGQVCVWVRDTGTGMPPEVAARVFEPFFTTKPPGKGTGLGLAQVYGFARQSGGTALVETELGQGTTVSLLLPRAGVPAPAEIRLDGAGTPGRGALVLMVEDDPVVAPVVAAALAGMGYQVARAPTAEDALDRLRSGDRVDLLFTDVVMPGPLNGTALAREARGLRPGLPVLLTTGYSEDVSGAAGFTLLPKPYRIEELAGAIAGELATRPGPAEVA